VPILYVHGVNTRSRERFLAIEPLLRRLVAPAISNDPDSVPIEDYFWGEHAFRPAWGGASRPRTRLLRQGADLAKGDIVAMSLASAESRVAIELPAQRQGSARDEDALLAPGFGGPAARTLPLLTRLTPDELSDLLAGLAAHTHEQKAERARAMGEVDEEALAAEKGRLLLAVDTVAQDLETQALIAGKPPEQQLDIVLERVRAEADRQAPLAAQGLRDYWPALKDRVAEALSRAEDRAGYIASIVAAESRPWLSDIASNFIGDVFVYLKNRDNPRNAPGEILAGLLAALQKSHGHKAARAGEPLVVLTHSMGGQLIWDAATWLLPQHNSDIRVDFWCATASQVGFFAEAKLFASSAKEHGPGTPVPFPAAHLGVWWNVWDHNDFLSFTAETICAGVDDEPYDSGSSLIAAHSGYLDRPSFYRAFARKLEAAKARGFKIA
jgi:hypothetical protein